MLTDLGRNPVNPGDAAPPGRDRRRARAELPYPEIRAAGKDRRYLWMLQDLYAGPAGEFTQSCRYALQSTLFGEEFADAAQVLGDIARTDMRHMLMLGRMIRLLGGDPRYGHYRGGRFVPWSGSYVEEIRDIKRTLLSDIDGKNKTAAFLRAAADGVENEQVAHALARIALDEDEHIRLLTLLYEKYK